MPLPFVFLAGAAVEDLEADEAVAAVLIGDVEAELRDLNAAVEVLAAEVFVGEVDADARVVEGPRAWRFGDDVKSMMPLSSESLSSTTSSVAFLLGAVLLGLRG